MNPTPSLFVSCPKKPRESAVPGRLLAVGWLYAAVVVLFASDIARLVLHLGSGWCGNIRAHPDDGTFGILAFVGLSYLAFQLVGLLFPTIEWDEESGTLRRPNNTQWFALAGLVAVIPLKSFSLAEPLDVASGGLMAVQAVADALLLRDVRQALPRAKRPAVMLRAMPVLAALSGITFFLNGQIAIFVLRVSATVLTPMVASLATEALDLDDVGPLEEDERNEGDDGADLRHATRWCFTLVTLVLAEQLIGFGDDAAPMTYNLITGAVYVAMERATGAMRVRALIAAFICLVLTYAGISSAYVTVLTCAAAVLILLSLFPADRTAEGLIAHLIMLVVGIRFLSGLELIPAAIEIMGPFFLVLTYIWQRYETRARERARHIRFHIR